MEDNRPYVYGTEGRTDKNGIVWFACDPYPTWYRWENGELITKNHLGFEADMEKSDGNIS